MKKTFFNISTRGCDLQTPTKTKRKFLKTFSFTSLALLMGIAGTMAFAPLGANPNNLASASTMDQVNTKADGENIKYAPSPLGLDPENDPVIYTTESGLEIKYGGENVNDQLASGKPLSGYPYFTMGTYSGYAVNWVIIGRNTNDTVFTSAISAHLYSTWKTNNNVSSATFTTKAKYWFNGGGYETTTPAGSAINGVVPSKSYVADVTKATKSVVANAEVPSGCVLAISEFVLSTSDFNATDSNYRYGNRYRYKADQGQDGNNSYTYTYNNKTDGHLYSAVKSIYENLNLLESQKSQIIAQKLSTRYRNGNSNLLDTFDTDGNTLHKLFPLAYGHSEENFVASQYLTSDALRVCYLIGTTNTQDWWTRSGNTSTSVGWAYAVYGNTGKFESNWGLQGMTGVRPACVIKLG